MLTHVLVYKALKKFLESEGYSLAPTLEPWKSPLRATHPEFGELEVYFHGENYTVDEGAFSPFPIYKRTRAEALDIWRTERTMLTEEAGHVCVAKAILLAIEKLAEGKRIALAFPDSHNFMTHLKPAIVHALAKAGIGFFIICSDLSVADVPAKSLQLTTGKGGLLIENSEQ
jgi:hypothetical protein